jgi:hypothetical protein
MRAIGTLARLLLIGLMVCGTTVMVGCTKKPSTNDISKLEESRSAAEGAERKLAELRQERMKLEADLQGKQNELQTNEKERDDLKNKIK